MPGVHTAESPLLTLTWNSMSRGEMAMGTRKRSSHFGSKLRSPMEVYPRRRLPTRRATYGCGGRALPVTTFWQPTRP